MIKALSVLALAALVATPAAAQDFKWNGKLARGKTLEVRGINGTIDATRASGSEASVTAVKRGRKSNPDDVEIKVIEHAEGVTICALYPSRRGRSNSCERGNSNQDLNNNDVEVRFTVQVPAGVEFEGKTVNGDVTAEDLPGDAEVSTVNGDIEVTASGSVEASTVNGSIKARMGSSDWKGDLEFTTVNGGISVTMPADVNAEVEASSVNGTIDSDFPVTMLGKMRRGSLKGRIGRGGPEIELTTVNGGIELRKAN